MKLREIAEIRTGMVVTRLCKDGQNVECRDLFRLINLKSISGDGVIINENIESVELPIFRKQEYLANEGDIIVRLSTPYSAAMIGEDEVGCLISSHFAIIRPDASKIFPPYLLWYLNSDHVKKTILQNTSNSTAFGTISSGFFADLQLKEISMNKQQLIGNYALLYAKEKVLTEELLKQKALLNQYITKRFYERITRGE